MRSWVCEVGTEKPTFRTFLEESTQRLCLRKFDFTVTISNCRYPGCGFSITISHFQFLKSDTTRKSAIFRLKSPLRNWAQGIEFANSVIRTRWWEIVTVKSNFKPRWPKKFKPTSIKWHILVRTAHGIHRLVCRSFTCGFASDGALTSFTDVGFS